MRRALVLGVAGAVLAAGAIAVATIPAGPAPASTGPHITRLFIPAIKAQCLGEAGIAGWTNLGYTFTTQGALETIDTDGSITGVPADGLGRLNDCLARYPIEPIVELPHDHYSRNLLYEYDRTVLKPCLEDALDTTLPELPARSDFVVRLYVWDPYPEVSRTLALDQLISVSTRCPAVPPYLDDGTEDPDATVHALSSPEQQKCFTIAGIITYPAESWGVRGIWLTVYDPEGNVVAALNTQVTGQITGRSVLDCLHGVSD